ncbi:MAG: DUF86 domain-containing protein [Bacteroidetes bacterium]|nr:DUF86 domain-containing protein [Bacteroidota bacterium]
MLDETTFILNHTENITREDYMSNKVLCRASIRSLEIIEEATKKLTDDFKNRHSKIEWKKIAGTRDKLIHDYYGIDYEIVWDIITSKNQELHQFLKNNGA